MKIIEAKLYDIIQQLHTASISFSRATELINEEFAKPVTEEQAKINLQVMARHCLTEWTGDKMVFSEKNLLSYFKENAQSKNYKEYDQL